MVDSGFRNPSWRTGVASRRPDYIRLRDMGPLPDLIVAGWLWVESLLAARGGMSSQNMSQALLNEAKEIMWPI